MRPGKQWHSCQRLGRHWILEGTVFHCSPSDGLGIVVCVSTQKWQQSESKLKEKHMQEIYCFWNWLNVYPFLLESLSSRMPRSLPCSLGKCAYPNVFPQATPVPKSACKPLFKKKWISLGNNYSSKYIKLRSRPLFRRQIWFIKRHQDNCHDLKI